MGDRSIGKGHTVQTEREPAAYGVVGRLMTPLAGACAIKVSSSIDQSGEDDPAGFGRRSQTAGRGMKYSKGEKHRILTA